MNRCLTSRWTFVALALLVGLGGLLFGQKFGPIGQFGDDKFYVLMAAGLEDIVFKYGLNEYRLQRVLPPALVHYSMKLFHMAVTVDNIRLVWSLYNVLLYGVIGWLWCGIGRELKISVPGQWLGFATIFISCHLLKYIPYISVSTDVFAYAVTMGLVYAYLRNNWIGICALMILGSFTWPTIVYTSMALLMFPRTKEDLSIEKPAPWFLNYLPALLVVVPIAMYMGTVITVLKGERIYSMGVFSMGANRPRMDWILVSTGLMLGYLFFALGFLFNNAKFFQWSFWRKQFHIFRIVLTIIMVAGIKLTIYYTASTQDARPVMYLITNLLIVSTMQPAIFLLNHVLFFGPVVIFVPFLWKQISRIVQRHGLGLVICVVLVVLFSLDSESRKQMNTWPLLLPFVIKAVDGLRWTRWHYAALGVLIVAASRVWYTIDGQNWGNPMEFPAQSYYMIMGPWMSYSMYALQGACVLAATAGIYFGFIYRRKGALQ